MFIFCLFFIRHSLYSISLFRLFYYSFIMLYILLIYTWYISHIFFIFSTHWYLLMSLSPKLLRLCLPIYFYCLTHNALVMTHSLTVIQWHVSTCITSCHTHAAPIACRHIMPAVLLPRSQNHSVPRQGHCRRW